MRSGIFNLFKYAWVLWLALPILVSARAVNTRQILSHQFILKDSLPCIGILTENIDEVQENVREGTNSGINSINVNLLLKTGSFIVPNYFNPQQDFFRCLPEGFDETLTENSTNRRVDYTNLSLENHKLIVDSYHFNSGSNAALLAMDLRIRHPWWILWYVNILVLLLLSTAFVFFVTKTISRVKQQEREKAEVDRKIAELEIMALQAQMNPHFIFNSINSIQYFVLSNKTDDVLSYLSDFSKVVRGALANVAKKKVPLLEEIDFLKSYLRIERMRFPDKFEFTVDVKGAVDSPGIMIPPYLIQPFTENAVKHGFMHKKGTGHLFIVFEEFDSETLRCTITDDGIGRAKALEMGGTSAEPARPPGSVINETRIRLLNTPEKPDRYKVIYTDLTDSEGNSTGLKVEVYLPIEST
jgi:hypothetical protein